jgi:hypothetical protein
MVYVCKYDRDPDGVQRLKRDLVDSSVPGLSKEQVVRDVFSWRYYQKMRTYAIVQRLNRLGILSAGKPGQYEPGLWSRQTVIQMMKNRSYIGEHLEGGTVFPCPQFVDPEVFEGVQQMFAENKRHQNGRPSNQYLFANYFWCTKCGHRMITNPGAKAHGKRCPVYVCGHIVYKPYKRLCHSPQVPQAKVEAVGFKAIWKHITHPELLLANAKAFYNSLPKANGIARLEKELSEVTRQMEKTQMMVRSSAIDEQKGIALIKTDQQRIAEIKAELRSAGSVVTLPPLQAVEAAMRHIAEGPEPETYEERRPILEKLVDLKLHYYDGELEIEGKVPVAESAEGSGSNRKNCNSSLDADPQRPCGPGGPKIPSYRAKNSVL